MKLNISKEWCLKMAGLEGDNEVGAGAIARDPALFSVTELVEEVPGVPEQDRFFICHNHEIVWKGPTQSDGEAWAEKNNIKIVRFVPFEP